jgi:tetratricopeptide (TPR) repeat protein
LAKLIQEQRTLLILDGLEPLQYPPGAMQGKLRDQGMQTLLKELARAGSDWGLCVITTRLAVPELAEMKHGSVQSKPLDNLSDEAGTQLLRDVGVSKSTDDELRKASGEFRGHALALTLLGRYLAVVHNGEIRKRDLVPQLEEEEEQGGHAFRVMKSYETWLEGKPELDILNLLGLFDRPAEGGAIEVLRQKPAIKGLTNALIGLADAKWKVALQHLRDLRLLDPKEEACPETLDCHPLVREHFGAALKAKNPAAWKEAHSRLYEYYKTLPAKKLPDTLEEMEPLYRAVAHGCHAGRYQEAMDEVYWPRISRHNEAYSVKILGAFGVDLAALSGFFEVPWGQPTAGLDDPAKAAVLGWAGFALRAVGRLREAREPMQAGLEMDIQLQDWENAAKAANNLSELSLTLGEVNEAVRYARQGVEFADRSGYEFLREAMRSCLAEALHQTGGLSDAESLFREAEDLQKKSQPEYPLLYSLQGYQFCDLLLSKGAFQQVLERADQTLKWVTQQRWLLDIALDNLSLGRAALLQAQVKGDPEGSGQAVAAFQEAKTYLDLAVKGLREAEQQDELPRGLLARAEFYRVTKDYAAAWRDLEEVHGITERGEMRLFLADYHLEAARLSHAEGKDGKAREHLATAKKMVEEMGYGRHKPEVEELEKQLRT